MGHNIDIVHSYTIPYGESEPFVLSIPSRDEITPALEDLESTDPDSVGANGTVSNVTTNMEYSTDPNAAPEFWTTVVLEGDLELPPGTYYFREISDGESFATESVEIVITAFPTPDVPDSPADSPAPDSSAAPLDLATTGLNLNLAYLLVALLLVVGCVIPTKAGIHRNIDSPNNKSL
jgi:hypothetical protein